MEELKKINEEEKSRLGKKGYILLKIFLIVMAAIIVYLILSISLVK
jgi:hypothetical protein